MVFLNDVMGWWRLYLDGLNESTNRSLQTDRGHPKRDRIEVLSEYRGGDILPAYFLSQGGGVMDALINQPTNFL